MPIVIHGYSHDFTNFKSPAAMGVDGNASPITMDGISLEIVPHSPSKRSTTIVSGASGWTITLQAIFLIGICTAISIAA